MSAQESIDEMGLAVEIVAAIRALPSRATANVRALRRTFSRRIAHATPESVVALALRLLDEPDFEYRFVAYELVCHHPGALRSLGRTDLAAPLRQA